MQVQRRKSAIGGGGFLGRGNVVDENICGRKTDIKNRIYCMLRLNS